MAKKNNAGADSTELLQFDQRTKAVSARVHTMDNMKEKISKVREVAPSSSKDDIIQVLHHFDGDADQSIDAFRKDGAQEILSQWNIPNRKGKGGTTQNKKNKKKKHKGGQQNDVALSNGGDVEPTVPNNNNVDKPTHPRIESLGHSKDHEPNNNVPKDSSVQSLPRREPNRSRRESPKPRTGNATGSSRSPRREPQRSSEGQSNRQRDARGGGQRDARGSGQRDARGSGRDRGDAKTSDQQQRPSQPKSEKQRGQPNSRPNQQSGRRRNISEGSDKGMKVGERERERTTSESSTSQDKNKPKNPGSVLERVSKDLQRTQVSLTRHKNLLNEECDRSEKRLRKAFEDIRQCLEYREAEMLRQLKEVKRQSTILLENRQEKALELKMETAKAASMSDHQLSELRADIKHFVSERKIDEEIGRTMRFTWNPDPVEQEIKSLGEVMPIKTNYATRRPSITSDTSGTFSRTTSVSEDPSGPLSRGTSRIDSSVPPTPTTPDMDMKAEVEHFAAKLQKSLDSRGGPRRRNDRSRSQGRPGGKNEQRGPKNQGQKQEQQPKGNQQGRRNRGGPPNRGGKDQGATNRRDRDRLSSSSSTGKGEESPEGSPKKSRSVRRREQYRRRHNQEKNETDTSKPVDKDASPQNKDSLPKTAEKKATTEVTVDSKSSSDSKQKEVDTNHKPVVNGIPNLETKTEANDSDVGESDVGKPDVVDSNTKPERPKELNITLNGSKENEVVGNHIEKEAHSKDTPVVNGDLHTEDKSSSDKPIMNGTLSSGGDTSPADEHHTQESTEEGLPQRQPKERKERQVASTELVKEVSTMNGVVASGDQTPVDH